MSLSTSTDDPRLHRDLPPDIFVGRQAILDADERAWAYELRYGQIGTHVATPEGGDALTLAHVLMAVVEAGTERAVGQQDVLIFCPPSALVDELPALIDRKRLILQVPADLEVTDAVSAALTRLRAEKVRFAVRWHHAPIAPDLLAHMDVVRFDVGAIYSAVLDERVKEMRELGLALAADGVADWDDHRRAKELGFDYFQGEFLCTPQVVQGRRPPSNHIATLAILSELQREDVSVDELELHLQRDVGLSFRLLRCVSSAANARRSPITSVKHAIVMLGLGPLRRLVTMLTLSSISEKPPELLQLALTRAAMCQQLAVKSGRVDANTAYTVGLFSVLDALLDWPMEAIVKELPVSDDITRALVEQEGPAGEILRCALAYEAGLFRDAASMGLSVGDLSSAFLTAISWAEASRVELSAA